MKYIIINLWISLIGLGAFAQQIPPKTYQIKTIQQPNSIKNYRISYSPLVSYVMSYYLAIKDALVEDNSIIAANYGKLLMNEFLKFDYSYKALSQKERLIEIIEDACERSENIWNNSGKIELQREHFENLSLKLKDMVLITGLNDDIYQVYCPMYNNKKGGIWFSLTKKVKNPYFGNKMLNCGTVQREYSVRWN